MEYIKEPKRKRHVYVTREQPFPVVIESVSGIPVSERLWQVYTGRYNGDNVVVEKESDIHSLYTKGFFGKGSLSKNFPTFGKFKNGIPPFISERQWKQRCKWKEALAVEELQKTNAVSVKVEDNIVRNIKEELLSDTEHSSSGLMNIDNNVFLATIADQESVKEAGPQAFPPGWQSGQEDTSLTETVSTSYRTPTIRFHREPPKKRSTVAESMSGPTSSDSTPSGSGTEGEILSGSRIEQIASETECEHTLPIEKSTELKRKLRKRGIEKVTLSAGPGTAKHHCDQHHTISIREKNAVEEERGYDSNERGEIEYSHVEDIKQEVAADAAPVSVSGENPALQNTSQDSNLRYPGRQGIADEVVVLHDSDSEDEELSLEKLEARLMQNPYQLPEQLHLMLEEAFFLCYALGCLQILDLSGKLLTLRDVWETFRASDVGFVQKYVAYHHFRAKGWVVKSGMKYGGDFLLYKEGPPFYHASYIVLVEVLKEADWSRSPSHNYRSITWPLLFAANRLAETVAKEILMCRVVWPTSVAECGPDNPKQLARFCVEEVLLRRWVSSQEREELDKEDIIE